MSRPRISLPQWLDGLPVVSVGLAALWLTLGLALEVGFAGQAGRGATQMRAAVQYALDNPAVQVPPRLLPAIRAVMPGFESNEMFAFLRDAGEGASGRQMEFDGLAAAAFERVDSHPHRTLGLVPVQRAPHQLASHWLLHSGILHLLATLLVWLLLAPVLEKLWGKRVFACAMLVSGLLGASVFGLLHSGADRALLGAGSLVACAAAALVVRFQILRPRTMELDLLAWVPSRSPLELSVPAWAVGILWAAYEGAGWWLVRGAQPGGLDNAVGYTAHAVAVLGGALAAISVHRLGWEERFGEPVAAPRPVSSSRFDFEGVLALRAGGDAERAFELLQAELKRSARNRDAVTTFWQMCIERSVPEQAATPMQQLVREELRRGAEEVAVAQWRELVQHLPSLDWDIATLFQLASAVRRIDGDESSVVVLQQLLEKDDAALDATGLARVARLADELSPPLALEAARRALALGTLAEGPRIELEQLAQRHTPPDEVTAGQVEQKKIRKEPPRNVFYDESDRSAFGQVDDLSSLEHSFPDGAVFDAQPRRIDAEGVQLEIASMGDLELSFARLRAVAVAGVHGLGPKPVVLVDLIVDGGGSELPLRVLRLRSDRFSPRRFFPQAGGPLDALRSLVRLLLSRSQARPLPDLASAEAQPVQIFESVDQYQERVLRPCAASWA